MDGQLGQPSRLTFRDKVDVCWQKQLRDQHNAEGVPPVPHLDIKRAIVRPVSRELAKQIIYKYEWLGTMASTSLHYGIFFGMYCAGVCCVAVNGVGTAGPYVGDRFKVERNKVATLARGACVHWSPIGSNTKLVSWACKLVARETESKIIIAYSDSDAGEVGTIYQACNWVYTGLTTGVSRPDMNIVSPSGRVLNRRSLGSMSKYTSGNIKTLRERLKNEGWTEQSSNPKHRYVYVLDKSDRALVDRVERMRQPYPKRVPRGSGEIDNAADTSLQTGGASPTDPLLIEAA
jgi:hypothetical protein